MLFLNENYRWLVVQMHLWCKFLKSMPLSYICKNENIICIVCSVYRLVHVQSKVKQWWITFSQQFQKLNVLKCMLNFLRIR